MMPDTRLDTRQSKDGTGQLADAAPVGLVLVDADGVVIETNSMAANLLGQPLDGQSGQPLSRLIRSESAVFDLIRRARDGERDAAASRQVLRIAERDTEPLDIRAAWVGDGTVCLGFWPSPISRVSDAAGSLSDFAKIFGHEVKTPLAAISGAAQLLASSEAQETGSELLGLIVSEADRLERVIARLTDLETLRAPRRKPSNIHEIIDRVIESESLLLAPGASIERRYDPSLPDLMVDPDHIHQALQNLVRNAVEACAGSGSARVILETHYAMQARLPGRRERGAFAVSVIDNGPGIPPEKLPAVFDPFFTTKSGGTGIGLSVVRDVVAGHGGALDVASWPGVTRFTLHLPLVSEEGENGAQS